MQFIWVWQYHRIGRWQRGWNSSVGSVFGSLSSVMQRHRFNPPLSVRSGRGNISVEVNMGSDSFRWEYFLRSSLCTHAFHHMDSKDPDIHVLDGWMPATKTHPAWAIQDDRMCSTSMVWFWNGHIHKYLTRNGEPQRSSLERRRGVFKKIKKMTKITVYCLPPYVLCWCHLPFISVSRT